MYIAGINVSHRQVLYCGAWLLDLLAVGQVEACSATEDSSADMRHAVLSS